MSFNFDDLVSGAKDVFDKAAAKAGEAIDYSKTQIDRGQLKAKIKEKYCDLGKICYNMHECGDDDVSVNAKRSKECRFCGTANDAVSAYCTKCGEKL